MPDPIDELENFSIPGPPMTPMPAAEVRRRGNRIRRRNNALAAAGGLAVVAAITVPFAMFAGSQTSSTPPQPAPPTVEWQTSIPGSFDLTAVPAEAPITFDAEDRPVVDDLLICDTVVFSTGSTSDGAGASYQEPGTESSAGRTLAVYADDQQAATALADFRSGIESCPTDQENRGARLEYDVVAGAPAAAEDGFVYSEQVHEGDLYYDLSVVEVAQIGNAIFVGTTHGGPGGDDLVAAGMLRLADLSDPVLAQMCVFSAVGCEPGDQAEDPAIGEGAVPAIPSDFPLADGLPTGGLEGRVPSPEPAGCDRMAPAPDAVETSRAQWRSISEIRDRQLMTFATQADAEAYVDNVVTVFCPEEDKGGGATRVTAIYPGDLGDYSVVGVGHNELDGELDPGLVLTHVVRVGRAVLLAQRIDEGYTWTGDVDQQSGVLADDSRTELEPLADAMCTFTETGC